MPEITGYAFPNDIHVHWSLMIVMYPYITGFVAGAFIVSALFHVFGREEFRPVARLAMATSLCFMAVATLPLNLHLGHPVGIGHVDDEHAHPVGGEPALALPPLNAFLARGGAGTCHHEERIDDVVRRDGARGAQARAAGRRARRQ